MAQARSLGDGARLPDQLAGSNQQRIQTLRTLSSVAGRIAQGRDDTARTVAPLNQTPRARSVRANGPVEIVPAANRADFERLNRAIQHGLRPIGRE